MHVHVAMVLVMKVVTQHVPIHFVFVLITSMTVTTNVVMIMFVKFTENVFLFVLTKVYLVVVKKTALPDFMKCTSTVHVRKNVQMDVLVMSLHAQTILPLQALLPLLYPRLLR